MNTAETLSHLLAPISPHNPAGEDLYFDPLLDRIREERRSDDPSLARGDWDRPLKTANWRNVLRLSEEGLASRAKDLQLVMFYAEAANWLDGFDGARCGLALLEGWLEHYWASGFPRLEGDDLDERRGKIQWLNDTLSLALRRVPLTPPERDALNWFAWKESRDTEDLKLRSAEEFNHAVQQGKLSAETFDQRARGSGLVWFSTRRAQLLALLESFERLDAKVDARFGAQAPRLAEIRSAIEDIFSVVDALWQASGGRAPTAEHESVPPTVMPSPAASSSANPVLPQGPLQSREAAIGMLLEVARYFRTCEPHSPVAPLVERAARWARMSVEEWLTHVIKDEDPLRRVQDLLDVKTGPS